MTSSPTPLEGPARGLPVDHSALPGKSISHSQLSHSCLLALKFARERQPWPFRNVALVYGQCVHAGIESWHWDRNLDRAIKAAHLSFMSELGRTPEVRFDDRQRRGAKTSAITDAQIAEDMLVQHLTAYHERYKDEAFKVLNVEKTIYITLQEPPGWRVHSRIDCIIETGGGAKVVVDLKTSSKPWTDAKLRNSRDQMELYLAAELRDSHKAPDYGEYRVLVKGSSDIQTFRIDFDLAAVNRLINLKLKPTIAAIEGEAWIANTDWFGHDERWCPYWSICGYGAAAEAKGVTPDRAA